MPPKPATQSSDSEFFQSRNKVIDLLAPLALGGKAAMFAGARVGKTVFIVSLIRSIADRSQGTSAFAGLGERSRKVHEFWLDLKRSSVIDRAVLVFGHMNWPPGARSHVAHSTLTVAEFYGDFADPMSGPTIFSRIPDAFSEACRQLPYASEWAVS